MCPLSICTSFWAQTYRIISCNLFAISPTSNRLEFQSVRSDKGRLVITPKLPKGLTKNQIGFTYANEADMLNVALFEYK